MNNLLWYIHRLKRMPALELPYRCEQLIKQKVDKRATWVAERNDGDHHPNLHSLMIPGAEIVFPGLRTRVVAGAEKVLEHRFRVFGIEGDFGDPIDWHLDPKTGKRWPLVFWGDIDYRDGYSVGGIKFAWELNRLHHLPLLAMAWQMMQEHRYRAEIFDQLRSWLDGNPYPKGINWISGIEIGIRIVNLVYSLRLLGDEPLEREHQDTLTEFVLLSARHLHRYHSKYSSCANHAVAEALGLFTAGLCFPGIKGATTWKGLGRRVLEHEVGRQICADGSGFEHSVPYLKFVSELFLVYFLLGREYGEPCSERVSERLRASFEFMSSIADENGNYPRIGDGDDGCLLKFETTNEDNFVSLLNTGAVLFDNPNWILEKADYDLMTFCLLGDGSKEKWERLRRRGDRRGTAVRHFADAGLVTTRDKGEVLFVGNAGPLGLEPLGGHGHADCLSFWLSVRGQPIVVDPGTYLYHSGGKWRHYFRSTSAHGTVTVDGQDQAVAVSDFMFDQFYHTRWMPLEDSDDCVVWSAEHDGYTRLKDPVVHRRTITYCKKDGTFIIENLLSCEGTHTIESLIHLHPDCLVSLSKHLAMIRCGAVRLTVELDRTWDSVRVVNGQEHPPLGWYSPRFNEIQKSPTIVCCKKIDGTSRFTSVISVRI